MPPSVLRQIPLPMLRSALKASAWSSHRRRDPSQTKPAFPTGRPRLHRKPQNAWLPWLRYAEYSAMAKSAVRHLAEFLHCKSKNNRCGYQNSW